MGPREGRRRAPRESPAPIPPSGIAPAEPRVVGNLVLPGPQVRRDAGASVPGAPDWLLLRPRGPACPGAMSLPWGRAPRLPLTETGAPPRAARRRARLRQCPRGRRVGAPRGRRGRGSERRGFVRSAAAQLRQQPSTQTFAGLLPLLPAGRTQRRRPWTRGCRRRRPRRPRSSRPGHRPVSAAPRPPRAWGRQRSAATPRTCRCCSACSACSACSPGWRRRPPAWVRPGDPRPPPAPRVRAGPSLPPARRDRTPGRGR